MFTVNAIDWDNARLSIYSKTEKDVRRALNKESITLDDMQALLSPAAEALLEPMAQQSYIKTRQRFGHNVQFFMPLYLSNLCSNICTYCGFSMNNKVKRKTLDLREIENECKIIKNKGIDSILLVTGEHDTKVGIAYFKQVLPVIKQFFSYVAIEVQPLQTEEYAALKNVGLDAVMVYQETYHAANYAKHHLRGKKQDFNFRLGTPDRIASAGIDKIGLGALLGLADWRVDSFFVAKHLLYLEKKYWRQRFSLSFPRLRPCAINSIQHSNMTNEQLVQVICAFRCFNPDVELTLSTREEAKLRNGLFPLGITHISAESKTEPGGYAQPNIALEQFEIDDKRAITQIEQALKEKGLIPVFKDWESVYS